MRYHARFVILRRKHIRANVKDIPEGLTLACKQIVLAHANVICQMCQKKAGFHFFKVIVEIMVCGSGGL